MNEKIFNILIFAKKINIFHLFILLQQFFQGAAPETTRSTRLPNSTSVRSIGI